MNTGGPSTTQTKPKRTARLFRNGRNQAVRLPREYEFQADEVIIEQEGDTLRLTPVPRTWASYFDRARRLSNDVPDHLEDLPLEDRESF